MLLPFVPLIAILERIITIINALEQRCVERRVSRASTTDWVEVWVLVLAGLIGVGAAVAACTVCCLYSRYVRRHTRIKISLQILILTFG